MNQSNARRRSTLLLFSAIVALGYMQTSVASAEPNWSDDSYSLETPRLVDVVGHDHGKQITSPAQIVDYLKALHQQAPQRTQLVQYATSWQGRPLYYLVVSSKQNLSRLTSIQANMQRLSEPVALDKQEQTTLLNETIPTAWLAYGVHGNEISSSDAALLTAYHLLASESDETQFILDNTIVVIDPAQNPDGRARFVEHYRQTYGIEPAPHRLAAERNEPWPRGRTNHYLFDMNRDWFAQTQPETKGRVSHYLKFQPVVHVDIHEMGSDNSYYFPPPAEPWNPHLTENQRTLLDLYGKGNAAAFDQFGFDYFTREIFDAYYPGYGDTWPAFQGATGMTFEMASARGLAALRLDGQLLTYQDGVQRHFVSSMATLKTTAVNANRLLEDFVEFRRTALDDKHQYILAGGDRDLRIKLAKNLMSQGVQVHVAAEKFGACGKSYPAQTLVVKAGQGAGRLVRTLLDPDSEADLEFWQEQERLRQEGLPVELYDIVAWSATDSYNLDVDVCTKRIGGLSLMDSNYSVAQAAVEKPDAGYIAYLVPWGSQQSIYFLADALRRDVKLRSTDKFFVMNGVEYPAGTLLVVAKENHTDVHNVMAQLAQQHKVELMVTDSSWTDAGINFGSSAVKSLTAPKIAIAWDVPTAPTAAGNMRFVIERQFGYPTTPIRTSDLASSYLKDFDVLLLPDGGDYAAVLGPRGIKNLKKWVEDGGTLITSGRATRLLLSDGLDLLDSQLESNEFTKEEESPEGLAPASIIDSEDEYHATIQTRHGKPDDLPGVILRGESQPDHWLSGGVAQTLKFMVMGNDVYTPLKQGEGTNVVRFTGESELLAGGYMWEENRLQLAYKPAVMAKRHGAGQVIGFVTDPTFRAYFDGLNVIFANALFKAPAHTKGR